MGSEGIRENRNPGADDSGAIADGGREVVAPDEITLDELTRRRRSTQLDTEKDREFRCPICEARCTEALSSSDEYGHLTGCPRRPDHLPRGGKRLQYTSNALATDGGDER